MRFSIFGFLIGRAIALNRGVSSGTAATDGFVAGVVRPPVLGIVLVSALARNQAASAVIAPSAPTLDTNTGLSPNPPDPKKLLTITGTNFGTDPTAIQVIITTTDPNTSVVTSNVVPLPQATKVSATSFDLPQALVSEGLGSMPSNQDISIAVAVNGVLSNAITFQLP